MWKCNQYIIQLEEIMYFNPDLDNYNKNVYYLNRRHVIQDNEELKLFPLSSLEKVPEELPTLKITDWFFV